MGVRRGTTRALGTRCGQVSWPGTGELQGSQATHGMKTGTRWSPNHKFFTNQAVSLCFPRWVAPCLISTNVLGGWRPWGASQWIQWAVVLVKELLWAVLLDLRFGDLPSKQVFLWPLCLFLSTVSLTTLWLKLRRFNDYHDSWFSLHLTLTPNARAYHAISSFRTGFKPVHWFPC